MRCCGMTPKVIKIHGKHGMNSRMQPNEKTRKSRESQVQQTKNYLKHSKLRTYTTTYMDETNTKLLKFLSRRYVNSKRNSI